MENAADIVIAIGRPRLRRRPGGAKRRVAAVCPDCGWDIQALLPPREPPKAILAQLACEACGHPGLVRPVKLPAAFVRALGD